ncbi:MAG: apiosidase-like domain-containing protein [Thermoguttaceae bacterium]
MTQTPSCVLLAVAAVCLAPAGRLAAETPHVWEKVEITLQARRQYKNPYTDVEVWVDLKGPGFERRCYGFWDGGSTFRVRVLATAPGRWTWESGASAEDPGLQAVRGEFTAAAWTEAELDGNPCRRGMIRASSNGHAFQYADGTPFFLLGDTWWATPTFRFRWYDDDTSRPLGPTAGFKDYVRYRRNQQYNCIAMIAAFPNWANDGKPARWKTDDGTILRWAWPQAGTESAKDMTDEAGRRAFYFPGAVPGCEEYFPDLNRICPEYFQSLDKKVDYLNAQGMVPFIEVARRDIGQAWRRHYPWPDSYTRYIQYVWSRSQANICLFSPIHLDTPAQSIPVEDWNAAANLVIQKYGHPPFGTLAGTNSNPSSLQNWGHTDRARWLGFHQIGNRRTHDVYQYLTEIFRTNPPVPAVNGEPYYDGMEDAEPGSDKAARYCRSAMYGSVLSGGLGGHIYGAGGWQGGLWSGEVEAASDYPIWEVLRWPSAAQMQHLKTFVLSEGQKYQDLLPAVEILSPNRSGEEKSLDGWSYCAATEDRRLLLLYFEQNCRPATLSGLPAGRDYSAHWFDPRTGRWLQPTTPSPTLTAGADGILRLPPFPDDKPRSAADWALKLLSRPR